MSTELVTVPARCLCGQLRVSSQVPTSTLPLQIFICHCNSCNTVSGHLAAGAVLLPEGATPLKVQGTATGYKTSDAIERCICGECGSSVFGRAPDSGWTWYDSGALDVAEVDVGGKKVSVAEPRAHMFVASTKDGGLRDWMPNLPAWEEWPGGSDAVPRGEFYKGQPTERSWPVKGRCHCGGVEIEIQQPSEGKYDAFLCVCNDCRLGAGVDVTTWVVIPKTKMTHKGTLKGYESTPGCIRRFCAKCGANVSFWSDKKPDTFDVAVGLLHGGNGHRMEDSLKWGAKIGYEDLAQKKGLSNSLAEGLKAWTAKAG